jgi:hypothetical protein
VRKGKTQRDLNSRRKKERREKKKEEGLSFGAKRKSTA